MGKTYDLLVRARGETKDAERAMKQLQRHVSRTGKNISNVGKTMSAAITMPLIGLGVMGAKELGEIERANAQTATALARLGPKSLIGVKGVQALSAALQEKSGIDDQVIQKGASLLLSIGQIDTRTKLGAQTFKVATRSMVEFAEQTGVTADVAAKQYAASMAAAANGTLKLPRGMKLSREETAKLKDALDKATTAGERQAIVADALGKKFAGSMNLTNADKWNVAMDKLAGSASKLVIMLLPAFDKLVGWVEKLTGWFDKLSPSAQKWVGIGLLVAAAMGPLLIVVGSLVTAVAALIPVITAITLPMIAIAAGIAIAIAAGVMLYLHWDEVKAKLSAAWSSIKDMASRTWQWIKDFISRHAVLIATAVTGPIGGLVVWMIRNWDQIKAGVVAAWRGIRDTAENWADSVVNFVTSSIGKVVGKVRSIWGDVREGVVDAWKGIRDTSENWASSVVTFIENAINNLPAKLKAIGGEAGRALANALKSAVNAVIDKWNDFSIPAVKVAGKQVTPEIDFPNLPRFARGGVTNQPGIFGEAGWEAAVPLGMDRRATMDRNRVMRESGLAGGNTIHVHTSSNDVEAIAQRVMYLMGSRRVAMGGAF
jgi:hypothetical protein